MEGFIFGILRYLNSFASQVLLGRVVQKVDKSIHWINLYLVDSVINLLVSFLLISWIVIIQWMGPIQHLKN